MRTLFALFFLFLCFPFFLLGQPVFPESQKGIKKKQQLICGYSGYDSTGLVLVYDYQYNTTGNLVRYQSVNMSNGL